MEEAREGLEALHRHSNYPMVRPIEAVQMEALAIGDQIIEEAEIIPEPDVFDEADLERALANMYNGREDKIPEPQPASAITANNATESFTTDSHADHAGRGLLDRARESLNETKERNDWFTTQQEVTPVEDANPWERPWEQKQEVESSNTAESAYLRAWGRDEPEWYQERETGTRIQSALSEAKDAGGSFSGSIFDEDSATQTTDTSIFGGLFDDGPISEPSAYSLTPEPAPLPEPTPTWSGQAIRDAMPSTSLATTLPEPTVHALREECTPGLVAAARMRRNESEIMEQNQPLPQPKEQQILAAFPALSSMLKSSPPTRLQSKFVQKEGRLARLARRSMRMLKSVETKKGGKNIQRRVEIKDDYASTYGDSDGFENGEFREVPLRSGQILRLRADQDHQAEIADRILSLSRSTGGEFAEDDASELVERLSASGDLEPIANLLKAADNNMTFSNLASTSPPKEKPGHHGISRLG